MRVFVALLLWYVLLWLGWFRPWWAVSTYLETWSLALLFAFHVCFVMMMACYAHAVYRSPSRQKRHVSQLQVQCHPCGTFVTRFYTHSRALNACVGSSNWKPYSMFLFYGAVCAWTSALGSMYEGGFFFFLFDLSHCPF